MCIRDSLKRVQLHWSTARYAPWQEAGLLDGLADLVQAQQVDELGGGNVGPRRLRWLQARLRERGVKLRSVQIQWSLLSPGVASAQELLDLCQSLDIEVLAYSPLAFGVLSCAPAEEPRPSTWVRQRLYRRLLPESLEIRQLPVSYTHLTLPTKRIV